MINMSFSPSPEESSSTATPMPPPPPVNPAFRGTDPDAYPVCQAKLVSDSVPTATAFAYPTSVESASTPVTQSAPNYTYPTNVESANTRVTRPASNYPFYQFVWPKLSVAKWIVLVLSGLVNLAACIIIIFYFATIVIYDEDGNKKPYKGICTDIHDMRHSTCVLSVGQFAYGIFCFGQINVGLICIGQINLGLLFGFGQVAAGIGYSIGQLACGWYVRMAQLAIAMYDVKSCQFGLRFLKCFFPSNDGLNAGEAALSCKC
mmetsp:Transcript_10000/g.15105  ORF Transcript_10000/g.15105 Transcript_10000/m.15105 type:complete len:261 (+) Transcript_10000:44-826(+)